MKRETLLKLLFFVFILCSVHSFSFLSLQPSGDLACNFRFDFISLLGIFFVMCM